MRQDSVSKVRIIGGQWRGRKLPVRDQEGLRPTGDRLRETLFNWLMPYIHGAECLDAFAGSGALGFEALSRGAQFTQFIEMHQGAAQQINANITLLNGRAEVARSDFLAWSNNGKRFDIVFLDPPFSHALWSPAIQHLVDRDMLNPQALVYIEKPANYPLSCPEDWEPLKTKRAGQVDITLYKTSAA